MLIQTRTRATLREADVTPEALYLDRRRFIGASAATLAGGLGLNGAAAATEASGKDYADGEAPNSFEQITQYNNFYEFGTDKGDPARHAHLLQTRPWTIKVDGECEAGGEFDLDALIKTSELEDRIYRLRCVEAWSMVIPWRGVPLATVLKRFKPTSKAKYVAFETLVDPKQMPGQKRRALPWPYREGLRMDEAMHPLTLLATGLYGKELPKQNGAPVRLIVPWKYGFKSIKSIVRIRFVEKQPYTTWNDLQAREYGFYANVNPTVDHPRWSQARERRIGELFKRKTLMFNGYADEVASLYEGMNLRKHF